MISWYKELLGINNPVPQAALHVCRIWRTHMGACAVRLWLFNKDFDEFDLLGFSCRNELTGSFQALANQLPVTSVAGAAFRSGQVLWVSSVLSHSTFSPDPAGRELFQKIPTLLSVPLVSLDNKDKLGDASSLLGVLDVHFQTAERPKLGDEDLLFLGSLTANTLGRAHSLERKTVFADLDDIALGLVVPAADKPFGDRKKDYFSGLILIILKAVYASCASIFVAGPGFDAIRCSASTGIEGMSNLEEVVYRKGDGATWTVFEKNHPLNSKNIQNDPSIPDYRGKFKETRRIRAETDSDPFLAVPIQGQQGRIATGVIRVLERRCHVARRRLQNFSQYDVDMLVSIAAHVSPVFRLLALHELRQRYIARMAHQVIQPLTGVLSYSANLLEGVYSDPKEIVQKLRYMRAMSRSAVRLTLGSEWVALARDFTFLRAHPRTARNLRQYLLERILDMQPLRESDGVSILLADEAEVATLGGFFCDDMYFDQVVMNVLHNAVKYSYPGTTIGVIVGVQGRNLLLDVTSYGIPIEDAERERIFCDMERGRWAPYLDPNGTGQGLCICRQIMHGFGGSIELLQSRPSTMSIHVPKKGLPVAHMTTFRIVLPEAFR